MLLAMFSRFCYSPTMFYENQYTAFVNRRYGEIKPSNAHYTCSPRRNALQIIRHISDSGKQYVIAENMGIP